MPPAPKSSSDADLMIEVMTDDSVALAEILRRHIPRVRAVLRSLFGMYGAAFIEDAEVATAGKAWKAAKQYDESRGEVGDWLTKIAVNEARSLLRGRKQQSKLFEGAVAEMAVPSAEVTGLSESDGEAPAAIDGAHSEAVREAMATLSPLQQQVLVARVNGTGTYEEIAQMLGCTAGSARVAWTQGRKRLEHELLQRGVDLRENQG